MDSATRGAYRTVVSDGGAPVNPSQFSRRVLQVVEIKRGLGRVHKMVLDCGHTRETMGGLKQIRDRVNCDECRRRNYGTEGKEEAGSGNSRN